MKTLKDILVVIVLLIAATAVYTIAKDPEQQDEILVEAEPTTFSRVGVITVNNPGLTQGVMSLVYEEPGAPALTKELTIDDLSMCVAGPTGATPCADINVLFDSPFEGKRAVVEGIEQGDKGDTVLVRKLYRLEEGEIERVVSPGNRFISWNTATELIRNCQVDMVTQTHALDVYLTLEDGREFRAVEPGIDEVWDVTSSVQGRCGNMVIATE